jgi:hypothetical protein
MALDILSGVLSVRVERQIAVRWALLVTRCANRIPETDELGRLFGRSSE